MAERIGANKVGDFLAHFFGGVAVEIKGCLGGAFPVPLDRAAIAEQAIDFVVYNVHVAGLIDFVRQIGAVEIQGEAFEEAERK